LVLAYVDCDACSKLQDAISTLLFGKTFMQRGCVLFTEQAADFDFHYYNERGSYYLVYFSVFTIFFLFVLLVLVCAAGILSLTC
jgi:hypothetical protein